MLGDAIETLRRRTETFDGHSERWHIATVSLKPELEVGGDELEAVGDVSSL
jgi:hypothetical protein